MIQMWDRGRQMVVEQAGDERVVACIIRKV
jgi:hypothetical protein